MFGGGGKLWVKGGGGGGGGCWICVAAFCACVRVCVLCLQSSTAWDAAAVALLDGWMALWFRESVSRMSGRGVCARCAVRRC